MSTFSTTIEVDGQVLAHVDAVRTVEGPDGVDTYTWMWGIEHAGEFVQMLGGEVQHRDIDGGFKLLALIIEKIRGRKADR